MRLHNLFVCCLMMLFIQPVQSHDYAGSSNEPGNITSLTRNGLQDGGTYSLMDNLILSYDGNQLTEVSETATDYDFAGSFEYKKSKGSEYIYNSNGSLVADKSRGIVYITYDFNNNPQTIYFTNGYMTKYTYSALGDKLSVEHFIAQPNVTWAFGVQPDVSQSQPIFAGHTDCLVGGRLIVKEDIIKKLFFDGGYVDATAINNPKTYGFTPYYYNKDHLGNNREVVDRSSNVQQLTNYYPFGAPYADPVAVMGSTIQPYKYNGKELDTMHGLNTYDYGARQYNPIIGRWDRMDLFCESYYEVSPYVYCKNNPIGNTDPDGKEVINGFDITKTNEKKATDIYISKICDISNYIIIFAHGAKNGMHVVHGTYDKVINTVSDFESFLGQYSDVWNKRYVSNENISIVLFSCETGVNDGQGESFAQKVSNEFKGIPIIAPNDNISICKDNDGEGYMRIDNNKTWNEFTNGKITNVYPGDILPGTNDFEESSIWEKIMPQFNFDKLSK